MALTAAQEIIVQLDIPNFDPLSTQEIGAKLLIHFSELGKPLLEPLTTLDIIALLQNPYSLIKAILGAFIAQVWSDTVLKEEMRRTYILLEQLNAMLAEMHKYRHEKDLNGEEKSFIDARLQTIQYTQNLLQQLNTQHDNLMALTKERDTILTSLLAEWKAIQKKQTAELMSNVLVPALAEMGHHLTRTENTLVQARLENLANAQQIQLALPQYLPTMPQEQLLMLRQKTETVAQNNLQVVLGKFLLKKQAGAMLDNEPESGVLNDANISPMQLKEIAKRFFEGEGALLAQHLKKTHAENKHAWDKQLDKINQLLTCRDKIISCQNEIRTRDFDKTVRQLEISLIIPEALQPLFQHTAEKATQANRVTGLTTVKALDAFANKMLQWESQAKEKVFEHIISDINLLCKISDEDLEKFSLLLTRALKSLPIDQRERVLHSVETLHKHLLKHPEIKISEAVQCVLLAKEDFVLTSQSAANFKPS